MRGMLWKLFLQLRPYTIVNVMAVGLLAYVMHFKQFSYNFALILSLTFPIVLWWYANLISDFMHRKEDRRKIHLSPLLFIMLIILFTLHLSKNLSGFLLFMALTVCLPLYSLKVVDIPTSRFSYLFRGLLEVFIFLFVFSFFADVLVNITNNFIPLAIIYLITSARNLVGDIRDIKFDKYSFAKEYGVSKAILVTLFIYIIAILIVNDFITAFPLVLAIASMPSARTNSYTVHRLLIIINTVFLLNLVFFTVNNELGQFILNIVLLSLMLNLTYPMVPRKAIPQKM